MIRLLYPPKSSQEQTWNTLKPWHKFPSSNGVAFRSFPRGKEFVLNGARTVRDARKERVAATRNIKKRCVINYWMFYLHEIQYLMFNEKELWKQYDDLTELLYL